jgi:hypothetical protein
MDSLTLFPVKIKLATSTFRQKIFLVWFISAMLGLPSPLGSEELLFRFHSYAGRQPSQSAVDDMLDNATRMFQRSNCSATLSRCGSVRGNAYAGMTSGGIISNDDDLKALRPSAGTATTVGEVCELSCIHVFFVKEIRWCDERPVFPSRTPGCTVKLWNNDGTMLDSWIVLAWPHPHTSTLRHVVFGHEVGHARCLSHQPENARLLMHHTVTSDSTEILPSECQVILDPKTHPKNRPLPGSRQ